MSSQCFFVWNSQIWILRFCKKVTRRCPWLTTCKRTGRKRKRKWWRIKGGKNFYEKEGQEIKPADHHQRHRSFLPVGSQQASIHLTGGIPLGFPWGDEYSESQNRNWSCKSELSGMCSTLPKGMKGRGLKCHRLIIIRKKREEERKNQIPKVLFSA